MRLHPLKMFLCYLFLASIPTTSGFAAEDKKPQGPPPMLVEVGEIVHGKAQPMIELVGSVRYGRVSRVSAEVSGIVEEINFKEGERVEAGQILLKLRSDLLTTSVAGTRANHQQALHELERARKDLQRIKALYKEKSVSESLYDDIYYRVLSLEQRAAALKASLDRQRLELQKTRIPAPFSGLVQSKLTEQGEWVNTGGQIAVIADNLDLEIHIDVPHQLLSYLQPERELSVRSGGNNYHARFIHFIPQGDEATRTFTVKLKLKNATELIEGMEAHARLPNGPGIEGLLVPRDAVIKQFGGDVLFIAAAGKAKMIPVNILGYRGMQVAISGEGLAAGAQVVVKGNERIRDGQAIRF